MSLATRTMQSVLIGSEYPVMDTLLFYVKNGEKLELSIIIRSRRHSSLTLCSVSRSMYCFVMPQSRPKRSRLFTSTTSTFPARTASVSSCRAGRSRVNPEPCSVAAPTMVCTRLVPHSGEAPWPAVPKKSYHRERRGNRNRLSSCRTSYTATCSGA